MEELHKIPMQTEILYLMETIIPALRWDLTGGFFSIVSFFSEREGHKLRFDVTVRENCASFQNV